MTKNRRELFRILCASAMFLLLIPVEHIFDLPWYGMLAAWLLIYAFIGWDIVWEALGGIGRGQLFDENFLMFLATVGAFCTGAYSEAVAVMLLYQVGELFQRYAIGKSRGSITGLMELRPDSARVLRGASVEEVFPEYVEIGEHILVKPGERVPLDGVVVSGSSLLDTAALTGEAVPRECEPGDEILSGVIVMSGVLEIAVRKAYAESTVSKILEMVENAASRKAKTEKFITRFARYYTPVVVIFAVLLALVPPIFYGAWSLWMGRALNFLVVSCPCALVISVPLSFFGGIGAASSAGILIKGSSYLELLEKADLFVFDKTGTLTKGSFSVTAVYPAEKRDEILRAAAIAERGSLHPIARSIQEMANVSEDGWHLAEQAGFGVCAEREGEVILAGSRKLLAEKGIDVPSIHSAGTLVHVARNGVYLGCIEISDTLKEDSVSAVASLHAFGVKTAMLTGDREEAASTVAEAVGVSAYEAGLLPADKVHQVEALLDQKKPHSVLVFVGDGINDAPVLMRADLGVALGGIGSDAAIEAADIVLMHDKLSALPLAKRIAAKTMRIVRQNIVFALGVKLLVLALTPFDLVAIWLAIFADVGVAVLAILNAMRAGKLS